MKYPIILRILAFCALLCSCKSTQNLVSWEDTNNQLNKFKLKHVLIVGLFKNDTLKHFFEDQLAFSLNGKGVVSYKYLPADFFIRMKNKKPHFKIKAGEFDGVVVVNLWKESKDEDYLTDILTTKTNIISFEDYNIGSYFNRNSDKTNKLQNAQTIEVNVYSVKKDKFIWKGLIK